MRIIESTLQEDLLVNVARNNRNAHNGRMADIINKMEREQMEDVLPSLAEARPKAAEILRGLLFTFDDIIKLQPKSRHGSVRSDSDGARGSRAEGNRFRLPQFDPVDALGRARGGWSRPELSIGGPAPHREVVKARRMIADLALEMAERGELELNSEEDDEEIF